MQSNYQTYLPQSIVRDFQNKGILEKKKEKLVGNFSPIAKTIKCKTQDKQKKTYSPNKKETNAYNSSVNSVNINVKINGNMRNLKEAISLSNTAQNENKMNININYSKICKSIEDPLNQLIITNNPSHTNTEKVFATPSQIEEAEQNSTFTQRSNSNSPNLNLGNVKQICNSIEKPKRNDLNINGLNGFSHTSKTNEMYTHYGKVFPIISLTEPSRSHAPTTQSSRLSHTCYLPHSSSPKRTMHEHRLNDFKNNTTHAITEYAHNSPILHSHTQPHPQTQIQIHGQTQQAQGPPVSTPTDSSGADTQATGTHLRENKTVYTIGKHTQQYFSNKKNSNTNSNNTSYLKSFINPRVASHTHVSPILSQNQNQIANTYTHNHQNQNLNQNNNTQRSTQQPPQRQRRQFDKQRENAAHRKEKSLSHMNQSFNPNKPYPNHSSNNNLNVILSTNTSYSGVGGKLSPQEQLACESSKYQKYFQSRLNTFLLAYAETFRKIKIKGSKSKEEKMLKKLAHQLKEKQKEKIVYEILMQQNEGRSPNLNEMEIKGSLALLEGTVLKGKNEDGHFDKNKSKRNELASIYRGSQSNSKLRNAKKEKEKQKKAKINKLYQQFKNEYSHKMETEFEAMSQQISMQNDNSSKEQTVTITLSLNNLFFVLSHIICCLASEIIET